MIDDGLAEVSQVSRMHKEKSRTLVGEELVLLPANARAMTPGANEEPLTYINCGSGQDYGICRACGRGHGHVIFRRANANVDLPDTAAQDSASKSNNPAVYG